MICGDCHFTDDAVAAPGVLGGGTLVHLSLLHTEDGSCFLHPGLPTSEDEPTRERDF